MNDSVQIPTREECERVISHLKQLYSARSSYAYDLTFNWSWMKQIIDALDSSEQTIQRLHDLVRYQRQELFEEQLITEDEYAELAEDHPSVARLEGYDGCRARSAKSIQQERAVSDQLAAALKSMCMERVDGRVEAKAALAQHAALRIKE
jgi:DNA repair ATPase RecN